MLRPLSLNATKESMTLHQESHSNDMSPKCKPYSRLVGHQFVSVQNGAEMSIKQQTKGMCLPPLELHVARIWKSGIDTSTLT